MNLFNKTKFLFFLINRETHHLLGKPMLHSASLEITEDCNLACIMCSYSKGRKLSRKELTIHEWKQVLDGLIKLKVLNINFIGAEPLRRKEKTIELASYLHGKRINRRLSTNGTLINPYLANEICNNFENVAISLDAVGEKHDNIRGQKNVFEKACEGITYLVEARGRHKMKKPKIDIHTTIFNANYDEVIKLMQLAEKLRVDTISFQYLSQMSIESVSATKIDNKIVASDKYLIKNTSFLLTEGQIKILKAQLQAIEKMTSKIKPISFLISRIGEENLMNGTFPISRCYFSQNKLIISPYGDFLLCSHFNYSIGNAKEMSVEKAWGNKKHKQFIQLLQKELFPVCKSCCHFISNLTILQYFKLLLKLDLG